MHAQSMLYHNSMHPYGIILNDYRFEDAMTIHDVDYYDVATFNPTISRGLRDLGTDRSI
jgi:hypothetical protein